jgi:membrane carboxypeptidase/penicillin-binding protein
LKWASSESYGTNMAQTVKEGPIQYKTKKATYWLPFNYLVRHKGLEPLTR